MEKKTEEIRDDPKSNKFIAGEGSPDNGDAFVHE
jgi:hypothetical protein